MENRYKILVTDPLSAEGMSILKSQKGFDITTLNKAVPEDELTDLIPEYHALIVRSGTRASKTVIESGKNLKIIARAGVGIDNVDVDTATDRGILVINAPEGNTISTAEQTFALILCLARKVSWAHQSILDGKWDRKSFKGIQLSGRTIGVIGLGRIGREVAFRAKAFGMRILGYDPFVSREQAIHLGIELSELADIYKESDIITTHTPLTAKTRGLIGKAQIDNMKEGVLLINCARGGIYVEEDVLDAPKSGRIGGAAFDTFEVEPPTDNPLVMLPNFLSTPHLGAATEEAQISVAMETCEAIVDFFTKGTTRNSINFPAVAPEIYEANRPFLDLCEKLGYLLANLREGRMIELSINFSRELETKPTHIMKLAAIKGFLEPILSERINFINALNVAKERGIQLKESFSPVESLFPELITIEIKTDKGNHQVSGTLYHHKYPRIIEVDNYDFELDPVGEYLMINNRDMPGVVGEVGSILGESMINIATMQLGRQKKGSEALIFISVDEKPSQDVINKIKDSPAVINALSLSF